MWELADNEPLVTGASGHSAKYFFERLEAENFDKEIKCLVRDTSDIDHLIDYKLDLEFSSCDLENSACLRTSME